ncbi:MAG: NAD(P)-binding domain-containing protein [Spartobacteria bacterium]
MSRRRRKNVGIIGLGIIGSRVREVLRNKGFHVFVWNRTPRPVPNFVGAPEELAEMCDYIQLFVSDDDALLDVVKQLSPGLGAQHIVIAHSTVSPHTMILAGEIVARRGARFIEAPFTGSKEAAENGALVYYIGGDEAAIAEARPILEATSKELMVIGEIGHATVIKITTNMVTAATVQAAAEALALMRSAELSLEKFVAAMEGNASNSKTLGLKLPKMVDRNFEPHFSVKHMLKDMQIASRMGLSHHLELGITSAARDRLLEQMQRGYGDEDYSAVARKYFGDTPSGGTESDLELFNPQPPEVDPPWVDLHLPAESTEVPPQVETTAEPNVAVDLVPAAEEPLIAPSEVVADVIQEEQPTEMNFPEEPAPLEAEALEPEQAERRGFLGRLLRRESNS